MWVFNDKVLEDYENLYKELSEEILRSVFSHYPKIEFEKIEFSFIIGENVKHSGLLHSILELFPKNMCYIEKSYVYINIVSETDFIKYVEQIHDVWILTKSWKSTKFLIDNRKVETEQAFYMFAKMIFQKSDIELKYYGKTVKELQKKYNSHKRKSTNKYSGSKKTISKKNIFESFNIVIDMYKEVYGRNKEIREYKLTDYDKVIVIENDFIVDFRIIPRYWARIGDDQFKDWEYPYIVIQDITHNNLFKFNFSDFKRRFEFDYIGFDYLSYHGMNYYKKEIDNYNNIDKRLPQLNLRERYNNYTGELHHFLIFRMEGADGNIAYGIGETTGKIHSYVLKVCKELEEKNSKSLLIWGLSCVGCGGLTEGFYKAFLSWEGKKKRWRLENKFSYYYEDIWVKDDNELFDIPDALLKKATLGAYNDEEFGTYTKPINRWKTEELVYNITKKLYKDYQVIYQYKPYFLNTDKGCMSYDVYICGLKTAIEYQGKQHFEPVEYFGGEENYNKQKERDKLKLLKSMENGVKLVYVNYWEDITPELIRKKVEGNES